MNVAVLIAAISSGAGGGGGAFRQLTELSTELVRRGHRVTVVCGTLVGEPPDLACELRFCRVEDPPALTSKKAIASEALFQRRLRDDMRALADLVPEDTDVINAHDWPALHAGRIAAERLSVPLVWTRNDGASFEFARFPESTPYHASLRLKDRLLLLARGRTEYRDARKADAIAVLDTRNASMVKRAYRRSDADIAQSGPKPHFFEPPSREDARRHLGISADAFVLLGVGILFPHRRFEDLIAAVASVRDQTLRLVILGADFAHPAYGADLAAQIDELELGDRVTFDRRGFSEDELRSAYAAADLFVFPNEHQTWGLAPLEALASGVPVAVSTGAGVHEVLNGRSGVHLFSPRDCSALAQIIEDVRATPLDVRTTRVAPTRAWVQAELSAARYAERMLEIFERVVVTRGLQGRSRRAPLLLNASGMELGGGAAHAGGLRDACERFPLAEVVELPAFRRARRWSLARRLIWDQTGFPLVVARARGFGLALNNRPSLLLGRRGSLYEANAHLPEHRAFRALLGAGRRTSRAQIYPSAAMRDHIGNRRPSAHVVGHGVRLEFISAHPQPKPYSSVFPAWPGKNKRHLDVIRALRLVVDSRPEATLTLTLSEDANLSVDAARVGSILDLISELDLGDSVVLAGPVEASAMAGFIAQHSVVVMLTDLESFGLPVIEGRALGRHVVASDLPSLRELDAPGVHFVPNGDVAALATQWSAVLEAEALPAPSWDRTWDDVLHDLYRLCVPADRVP